MHISQKNRPKLHPRIEQARMLASEAKQSRLVLLTYITIK